MATGSRWDGSSAGVGGSDGRREAVIEVIVAAAATFVHDATAADRAF
jgi:hypothetical protein